MSRNIKMELGMDPDMEVATPLTLFKFYWTVFFIYLWGFLGEVFVHLRLLFKHYGLQNIHSGLKYTNWSVL